MIWSNSDWKRSFLVSGRKREFFSKILRTGITTIISPKKRKCWTKSRKSDSSPSRLATSTLPHPASLSLTAHRWFRICKKTTTS